MDKEENKTPKRTYVKVEKRLTEIKKKQEERKLKIIEEIKKENSKMRLTPGICKGSKKLISENIKYIPIHKRIEEITLTKKVHIEQLKIEEQLKKQIKERTNRICKNRSSKSPITQRVKSHNRTITELTTEEQEMFDKCTFKPQLNKRSECLFKELNIYKKPVVKRLLDYGQIQADKNERLMKNKELIFTPSFNNNTKAKGSFETTSKSDFERFATIDMNNGHRDFDSMRKVQRILFMTSKEPNKIKNSFYTNI